MKPLWKSRFIYIIKLAVLFAFTASIASAAEEFALWGGTLSRNMVSDEKNMPASWDLETGENIKWTAELGSQSYAGPLVIGGKVFVGTNNKALYDPKLTGDRGNLMAFRESDGKFLWQSTHTKLTSGRVNDWPLQGICSTPYIEGDRLYYISNRCEVVCIDTEGFLDDGENDGPFTEETETSETDADIIWIYDMMDELDVFPHNLATCSPLVVGDLLFLETSNGVDEGHIHIPSPDAPSFIALNKNTGELVWEDASPGENILHGQWSNPAYGVIKGVPQVIIPGGDGWVYAFEPETGNIIWKFDCNPKDSVWELGGRGTRNNIISTPVVYDDKVFIAVGQDPEHGEGVGHLWCIDASQTGDVTETAGIWHFGDEQFNRTMSTVAIADGLLYISDLSGFLYCLDVNTGDLFWKHDTFAAIWGSAYVVDGKVYLGDEDGDVVILKAGKTEEVLFETNMGSAVYTTPVAKDGVLYIVTRNTLVAIEEKK
ncbi:PQQ-binding-like beta-propeller repeat protein [Candidatus Poribacteria bacterium]|nr:PQQ-binding-like beta-propeller repeat protein [Candidatus Poribacteria bacterium]MYG07507.1 PQQ-binding-like beta-propeller repeat protein [Candidatus Poribacteria bacterium]MYK23132.1 PQQ-binding-like beta-propeller repeat protein [Candidatus Poribacteria bacterium]